MIVIRPPGLFDRELNVTILAQDAYARAVVNNLAVEMTDGLERTVGDCIVIDGPRNSIFGWDFGAIDRPAVYKAKIGDMWMRFSTLPDALAYVREVRAEQKVVA